MSVFSKRRLIPLAGALCIEAVIAYGMGPSLFAYGWISFVVICFAVIVCNFTLWKLVSRPAAPRAVEQSKARFEAVKRDWQKDVITKATDAGYFKKPVTPPITPTPPPVAKVTLPATNRTKIGMAEYVIKRRAPVYADEVESEEVISYKFLETEKPPSEGSVPSLGSPVAETQQKPKQEEEKPKVT